MHFIHHLAALAAALWLLWLPGWWLERRWSLPYAELRFPARVTAGTALWIFCLFFLASTGLYRAEAILALIALAHLLAFIEWRRAARCRFEQPMRTPDAGTARRTWLPVALALSVLTPILALAMTPAISWDADVYHLTLPRIYLESSGFQLVPMNVYSHWPQGIELLFGAAMALDSFILAKLLHFGFGLFVAVVLLRLVPGRAGWLAAAFFLLNDVVLFEMRVAYVDLAHAFALLAGTVIAARAAQEPLDAGGAKKTLLMTGLAAGLLVSLKVTGVVSAFLLAVLLLPRWLRETSNFGVRAAAGSVCAFAGPCLAVGAPWWIKTWVLTGNPLYPWLWTHFGGPDWSVTLGRQLAAWQGGIGMGRAWSDYLLLPWRVITQGGEGYGRFDGEVGLFWLAGLPLALLATRAAVPGHRLWRPMVLVALLHALFWAMSSQQMRFLIPVLALLAAPAAAAAAQLSRRWLTERPARRRLAAALLMISIAALSITRHGQVLGGGAGLLPALLHPTTTPQPAVAPVFERIARLPPDARLLFLNTNRGFFSQRPYLADSFFEASQINDWLRDAGTVAEVRQRLRERAVTHVLYRHYEGGGMSYPQPLFDLINDPETARHLFFDGTHLLVVLL